jgi:hypothetical protein
MTRQAAESIISQSITQLFKSERGRAVLEDLQTLLTGQFSGLDSVNFAAVIMLLQLSQQGWSGTVRDTIRINLEYGRLQ